MKKNLEAEFVIWLVVVATLSVSATLAYFLMPWIAAKLMHAGY